MRVPPTLLPPILASLLAGCGEGPPPPIAYGKGTFVGDAVRG